MAGVAVAVRHVPFEDLGILAPLLESRGYAIEYLEAGIDPVGADALTRADVAVVLGGPVGVYETDAYPFLVDELDAVGERLRAGRPTLGVCLGAQLMARALGAQVGPTGRKEIGFSPITLTPEGRRSVLAPLEGVPVLHWHGDQFGIPEGALRLAETPGFPNQAFACGDAVLGLQFHVEADWRRIEQWLVGHANELAGAGVDPRRIRADAAVHGPGLARIATGVLDAWLDSCQPGAHAHSPRL